MKISFATYKKQTDDLVSINKKFPPDKEGETEVLLIKKEKRVARSFSKGLTVTRPATRQSTILMRIAIKDKVTRWLRWLQS